MPGRWYYGLVDDETTDRSRGCRHVRLGLPDELDEGADPIPVRIDLDELNPMFDRNAKKRWSAADSAPATLGLNEFHRTGRSHRDRGLLVREAKSCRVESSRPGSGGHGGARLRWAGGQRAGPRGKGYEQDGRDGGYGHPCSHPHESSTASCRVSFREIVSLGS